MNSVVRQIRHPWTLGAWCALALSAALGVAVLWRSAGHHAGSDLAALSLVLLIGLGLLCGLSELCWRLRQLGAVERELDLLAESPDDSTVGSASAPLRALLQAPPGQMPSALAGAGVAPYLAGLLVVLGLSGTLLGLFESLRGAREVLATGGDVETLLTGLAQPLSALAGSLGSATAGIGASTLLGLCCVLVHRVETDVVRRAHEDASGALPQQSPEQDAQDSLQMLAEQARALPEAAVALSDLVARLDALSERWEQSHERSARHTGESLQAAVTASAEQLGRTLGERSAELGKHSAELREVASRIGERDAAQQTRVGATLDGLDRLLQSAGESLQVQRAQLEELLETTGTRIDQLATAAAHGAADTLEALRSQSLGLTERFAAQLDALREAQQQASQAMREDLAQQATRMSENVTQAGGSLGEVSEVLRATSAELSAVAEMFASSVERQQEAARSWLETLGELEGAIEHSGRASAADALGEQLASTQEVFARQLQFQRELFEQLKELRGAEGALADGDGEAHVHA